METIQEYFDRPETPAAGSPVGELMLKVLAKNPGMNLEEARADANTMLEKAAGRWRYQTPTVRSPEEQERQRERLRSAFRVLPKAA